MVGSIAPTPDLRSPQATVACFHCSLFDTCSVCWVETDSTSQFLHLKIFCRGKLQVYARVEALSTHAACRTVCIALYAVLVA